MPRGRECDYCGRTDGVCKYVIDYTDQPRRLTVNLCDDHNQGVERLAADFPPNRGSRRREEREQPHTMKLTSEWKVRQLRTEYRKRQREARGE